VGKLGGSTREAGLDGKGLPAKSLDACRMWYDKRRPPWPKRCVTVRHWFTGAGSVGVAAEQGEASGVGQAWGQTPHVYIMDGTPPFFVLSLLMPVGQTAVAYGKYAWYGGGILIRGGSLGVDPAERHYTGESPAPIRLDS